MSMCKTCQNADVCKYREGFMAYEKSLESKVLEMNEVMGTIPPYTELKHALDCKHYRPFMSCSPFDISPYVTNPDIYNIGPMYTREEVNND